MGHYTSYWSVRWAIRRLVKINQEDKIQYAIIKFYALLGKHDIDVLELAMMISDYCERFLEEEAEELETIEKYSKMKKDMDQYVED